MASDWTYQKTRSECVREAIDDAIWGLHMAKRREDKEESRELMRFSQALVNLLAIRGEVEAIDAAEKTSEEGTE